MGKPDVALKVWLGDLARFAELFNAILFDGKHVIDASQLEKDNIEYDMIVTDNADSQKAVQSFRDIVMIWKDEFILAILACENQEQINYGMPVRTMLYDSMEYTEQIRQISNKIKNMVSDNKESDKKNRSIPDIYYSRKLNQHKLTPVITLVVYYGDKEWDAPVELYDMLDINRDIGEDEDVLSVLKEYVPNYKINLVIPCKLPDYKVFSTDLHMVFYMLKYKKDRRKFNEFVSEHDSFFRTIPDDTLDVIKILLKTGERFDDKVKQLKAMNKDEEGSTDLMCIFDEIYEDGVAQGVAQGASIIIESIIDVLSTKGKVSGELEERIKEETNIDLLSQWIKKAIIVTDIEEFEKEILAMNIERLSYNNE